MKEHIVNSAMAGQRLDRYLQRLLPAADSAFLHRMLRKKNITVNGKKAEGNCRIAEGDKVTLFLSDETYAKFAGSAGAQAGDQAAAGTARKEKNPLQRYRDAFRVLSEKIPEERVVYEDADVLVLNKPADVLSQPGEGNGFAVNDWFVGRLLSRGEVDEASLSLFVPSAVNRLDRNTEGLLLLAKTLPSARALSALLRDRGVGKYYHMVVEGKMGKGGRLSTGLVKDAGKNEVRVTQGESAVTVYEPIGLSADGRFTLVEAQLLTGKTHQLRAHMAKLGHPIAGDAKYGARIPVPGKRGQCLACIRLVFPKTADGQAAEALQGLLGRTIEIPDPPVFGRLMR